MTKMSPLFYLFSKNTFFVIENYKFKKKKTKIEIPNLIAIHLSRLETICTLSRITQYCRSSLISH